MSVSMSGGGGGGSFSFSSSSVSYGGGGQPQVMYQQSSRTSMGPGGVIEHQEQVRDGRRGTERMTLERRLGDRTRRVIKQRTADEEETIDQVEGMDQEEKSRFDQEWQQAAQQSLPQWGHSMRQPQLTDGYSSRRTPHGSASRLLLEDQPRYSRSQQPSSYRRGYDSYASPSEARGAGSRRQPGYDSRYR
mmetsp:Transcript_8000/g.17508  ORF Transcript_8000/g.17508 Transcript_8000/m.17508 type:complete len:190 (+) Transcript_8000:140-709(+)